MIGAVDIGGTKIAVGMVEGAGGCCLAWNLQTDADRGYSMGSTASPGFARCSPQRRWRNNRQSVSDVLGQSIPALEKSEWSSFFPGGRARTGCGLVSSVWSSVAMENDADAVALGEGLTGAAKGKSSLICVTVGTGIGAASSFNAGCIEASTVPPRDWTPRCRPAARPVFCGARGCWEVLARGPAMSSG